MGLISDELYEALQKNCKGEYIDKGSRNELCLRDVKYFDECLSGINMLGILDSKCEDDERLWRRSLTQNLEASLGSRLTVPELGCREYKFFLTSKWANDKSVRKAPHIREGTIEKWIRCDKTDFDQSTPSGFEFHVNLSAKGYRSLIYSGDHDASVPFMSTQAWIRALNYSIVDDWRPWPVNDQVAGYTRTYSNRMTFATVKGAGHTTSADKPGEGFAMFTRWLSNMPL